MTQCRLQRPMSNTFILLGMCPHEFNARGMFFVDMCMPIFVWLCLKFILRYIWNSLSRNLDKFYLFSLSHLLYSDFGWIRSIICIILNESIYDLFIIYIYIYFNIALSLYCVTAFFHFDGLKNWRCKSLSYISWYLVLDPLSTMSATHENHILESELMFNMIILLKLVEQMNDLVLMMWLSSGEYINVYLALHTTLLWSQLELILNYLNQLSLLKQEAMPINFIKVLKIPLKY